MIDSVQSGHITKLFRKLVALGHFLVVLRMRNTWSMLVFLTTGSGVHLQFRIVKKAFATRRIYRLNLFRLINALKLAMQLCLIGGKIHLFPRTDGQT